MAMIFSQVRCPIGLLGRVYATEWARRSGAAECSPGGLGEVDFVIMELCARYAIGFVGVGGCLGLDITTAM